MRSPPLSGLSIVLPCFDEAERLEGAVRHATEAAEHVAATHEIVIVGDGGTEETVAAAARLAGRDPRVRLVLDADNGHGLRSGIAAARQPWVLVVDGRSHPAPWRRAVRRLLHARAREAEYTLRLIRRELP